MNENMTAGQLAQRDHYNASIKVGDSRVHIDAPSMSALTSILVALGVVESVRSVGVSADEKQAVATGEAKTSPAGTATAAAGSTPTPTSGRATAAKGDAKQGNAPTPPASATPAASSAPSSATAAAAPAAALTGFDPLTFDYKGTPREKWPPEAHDAIKPVLTALNALYAMNPDAAVGVLGQFGAKKASEVPVAKWPELLAAFKAKADTLKSQEALA